MNKNTETQRLAAAVSALAATILEIMNEKVKPPLEAPTAMPPRSPLPATAQMVDGWVMKKEVADHFKISLRTLHTWMQKGWLPYAKIGRSVRFKLSHVDAALKRRNLIDYPG